MKELSLWDSCQWISKKKNIRPENNASDLLGDKLLSQYMQMIGILRCGVKLGPMDIITERPIKCSNT